VSTSHLRRARHRTTLTKYDPVDAVIVGAGASGATAAKVLTEAGLTVVGLERGPWLKPDQFSGDELKYINRKFLGPDEKLKPRTHRNDENSQAVITRFSPIPNLVGGGTMVWAGWLPRPIISDFNVHSEHGDVSGASLADWPVSYAELEPYYTKVEWEFGVSGLAGANTHEPPRSRGFPCPPYPLTGYGKVFHEACQRVGYNSFPMPQAVVTTPHKGRNPTVHPGFWNEYPDPLTSKSTALTTFIPEALATGRYDLRPESYVRKVSVHKDGMVKGVIYFDQDGNEIEQEGGIVILCCGAIESARLLLMSKSGAFPDGLGNSSGLVGRNAMFHEGVGAVGLFDKGHYPLYGWSGSHVNGASYDLYASDPRRGHILGAVIASRMLGHPINWTFPGRPTWGLAAKDADRDFFNRSVWFGTMVHDLPRETNRVDLDDTVKDAWGLPVARITHEAHSNDIAQGNWAVQRCAELLDAAGASYIFPTHMERITANSYHEAGTARMGRKPTLSVLNEWCRAHDVGNLYVLDASSFPTDLGVNPTLTIMANAWRCSEYIAQMYSKGGV
jgi:choline dehydrogenase-like flavoprotein